MHCREGAGGYLEVQEAKLSISGGAGGKLSVSEGTGGKLAVSGGAGGN